MKCNECTLLLDDLLDCDPCATAKDVAEHLSICDACASEYALLREEKELYERCALELAPHFWAGLQARIATENGLHARRFASVFNVFRFARVSAAVTGLLIVLGAIGLWRYLQTRPGPREYPNALQVSLATTKQKSDAAAVTVGSSTEQTEIDNNGMSKRLLVAKPSSRKNGPRAYVEMIEKPVLGRDAAVGRDQMFKSPSLAATDLAADSARHLEQVEILLRSVKNSRSLGYSYTLDLTYESRLSKDLLVRNALLRHDADLAGDVPLTRLLDQFKPFLVEIANLRDNSDSNEIRQVKESLTKAQIVAALHSF